MAKEKDFAVKGGTAINLFVRDMPRLSVDIDLTYFPIEPREVSLRNINDGLKRMASRIKENLPGTSVKKITAGGSQLSKLVVDSQGVKIKIEPNTVIRGTVYPPEQRDLSKRAEEMFELSVSANILSIADLYGGKICAALDRQHPRDLFDIKTLFENEGIKPEIRKAFVVYLACHDRPISELLAPIPKDTRLTFKNEFLGMTISPVKYRDLRMTLKTLISTLKKDLSEKERRFLVLLKEGNPDWTLLDIPGIDRLPAIQWKLRNIHKMDKKKHSDALSRLKKILRI
ncbi:MAG: nucleotidyl transferase AbiEii/AbiGii toxin family protein [Elusimicrobia bacterium]|nr:nucleotidyl transferase AbiEii/AbiGii toxin family protein [Elusimicrobiota bacterium]